MSQFVQERWHLTPVMFHCVETAQAEVHSSELKGDKHDDLTGQNQELPPHGEWNTTLHLNHVPLWSYVVNSSYIL